MCFSIDKTLSFDILLPRQHSYTRKIHNGYRKVVCTIGRVNMVTFRSYFKEYTIIPKRACVRYYQDRFGHYVHHNRDGDELVHVESAQFSTDQWHARLLLLQPDCLAPSWREVRMVDGLEHPTFSDATKARGLLGTRGNCYNHC
jgi:hypothetical protein